MESRFVCVWIVILILISACNPLLGIQAENRILDEYNSYTAEEKQIVQQHNRILDQISNSLGNEVEYKINLESYLSFVQGAKPTLEEFYRFILQHAEVINSNGANAEYIARNTQNIIDTMDINAGEFRAWLAGH